MKKGLKIFLIIIACLFTCSIILNYTVFDVTYYGKRGADKFYNMFATYSGDLEKTYEGMINELGECDSYNFNVRRKIELIFESEAMTLVGNYSAEKYQKQKEYIMTHYQFATKYDTFFKYELDEKSAFEFDINNWHFYILNDNTDNNCDYFVPEIFRMVGFNDKDYKIAFMTFCNSDQDSFGENNDEKDLQSFVNHYYKYNFRK